MQTAAAMQTVDRFILRSERDHRVNERESCDVSRCFDEEAVDAGRGMNAEDSSWGESGRVGG